MNLLDTYKQVQVLWHQWQVDHPVVANGVVVVEGAALGALIDYVGSWLSGDPFSFQALKLTVSTAVIVALRNYWKDNIKNIKSKLEGK